MLQRRSFLKRSALTLGAIPVANLLASTSAWATGEVEITEDDPMAMALGYKHSVDDVDTAKYPKYADGQLCDNCVQYKATSEGWGTCAIFPGKLVAAKGWCNVWVAIPS